MVKSQKPKSAPTAGVTAAEQAREAAAQALVEKHPEGLPREPDEVKPEALPEVPPPAADPDAGEVQFHRQLGKTIQAQELPVGQPELTPDERAVLAANVIVDTARAVDECEEQPFLLTNDEFEEQVFRRLTALHHLMMQVCEQTAPRAAPMTSGGKPIGPGLTPADLEGLAMAAEDKGQKAPSPEARRSWDELAKKCRAINASLRA